MFEPKGPIYTLPHGIEVIGEYRARGSNRYARLRIRPHPFFPGVPVVANGIYVRKSRVLLAVKLGRALTREEHAHHKDEDRANDTLDNIDLMGIVEHNRLHKTGSLHTPESKARISESMKAAYSDGRHKASVIKERGPDGRITPRSAS